MKQIGIITELRQMLCPGTQNDCDNPGCRRGGCQGRLPQLPLFRRIQAPEPAVPAVADIMHRPAIERPEPLAA